MAAPQRGHLSSAFDFWYLSDNSGLDASVEVTLPVAELYVKCAGPAQHNRYRNAARRAIVLDAASVISTYGCSHKAEMC
jgi:hypothetical protein